MSQSHNYAKVETWKVADLIDATSVNPRGRRKVTIPEFQRRLVWSKSKQDALIKSIKLGYPFGSLLVYFDQDKGGSKQLYKLIDGLQRTQALRRYCRNPNSGFERNELSDSLVSIIAGSLNQLTDKDCMSKTVLNSLRDVILHWIWDGQGFRESDGWSIESLTDSIAQNILELQLSSYEFYNAKKVLLDNKPLYREPLLELLDSISSESDISDAEVPILVYTGDSSELPTVFTLLNTQGAKLSRYEIYAAQWLDCHLKIHNPAIIKAIWNKYEALEKHGFDLDVSANASNDESRQEREYTLFEYLFGLGQHLAHEYPQLFKSVEVDVPSPIGFNLVSACLISGVGDKDIRKLPDEIRSLDLQEFEKNVLESVVFVNNILHPVLSMKRRGTTKIPYMHADLHIISMIASAFQVRYDPFGRTELNGWQENRQALTSNLPMYYLFEILRESWRGSGDSNLNEILKNRLYLEAPPTRSRWIYEMDAWFDYNVNRRKHTKKYIKDEYPEHLLLRYVFAKKLGPEAIYEVDYIVPLSQLLSPLSEYGKSNAGPINTIGNLALVSKSDHVDFGDKTFVCYFKQRQMVGGIKKGPGHLNDAVKMQESILLCKADILPLRLTEKAFETFLRRRFDLLKREFLTVWSDHIPPDPQA